VDEPYPKATRSVGFFSLVGLSCNILCFLKLFIWFVLTLVRGTMNTLALGDVFFTFGSLLMDINNKCKGHLSSLCVKIGFSSCLQDNGS
jgi:hypothetical protein